MIEERKEAERIANIERDRLQVIEDQKKAEELKKEIEMKRIIEEKRVAEVNQLIKNTQKLLIDTKNNLKQSQQ